METLDTVELELGEGFNELTDELGAGFTDEKRLLTALPIFPKSLPIWPIRPGSDDVGVGVGVGVGKTWLEPLSVLWITVRLMEAHTLRSGKHTRKLGQDQTREQ